VLLLALALGAGIGLSMGAFGGGGAILTVPVFVLALGTDVHDATTASLVVVAAAATAGAWGHVRAGRVCWRHAMAVMVAAAPGVVLGTFAGEVASDAVLVVATAVAMGAAAIAMWRRSRGADREDAGTARPCPPLLLARDVATGLVAGVLTGLLGLGGGFLIVPTLAIALAFSVRSAIGTSLVIIAAISLIGLGAHLGAGRDLDPVPVLAMTSACVAGALTGGLVARYLPVEVLARGFAVLVGTVAVGLIASIAL
jgi:uncharacterized membrane protein YfcA